MAQVAQGKKAPCNTKIQGARGKARNYCFTLNNYTPEEVKTLCEGDYKYVFQEETGESGTPHLQGILMFKNAVSFKSIKKLIPRGHIEKCKNKNASIRYCSKEDTRTGEIYHNLEDTSLFGTGGTKNLGKNFDEILSEDIKKNREIFLEELAEEKYNKLPAEYCEFDYWVCPYGCFSVCTCK